MNRRIALFFAVLCTCASLNACTKVGLQTGQNAASHTIPGTLRYADLEEPTGLNPLLRLQAVATDLDMFIFGFFFNIDDKLHWVPELAVEVPTLQNGGISKDGLTITYHLRKGVKWQDGAPFTSHDVIFTTNAILNKNNNLQSRNGWDQLDHVEAVGDYEVKFHLKRPYAAAIANFFSESGNYPVLPAHLLEKYPDINHVPFNSNPVGTGPFKFVRWLHGDRIELDANPLYWRGPPKLQHIIYKFVPKDTTVLVQLQTHEIDAWFRAPSNLYNEIKKLEPQYRVQLEPSFIYSHIDLNHEKSALPRPPSATRDKLCNQQARHYRQSYAWRPARCILGDQPALVGVQSKRYEIPIRSGEGARVARRGWMDARVRWHLAKKWSAPGLRLVGGRRRFDG